jgi:hypothetical protein
MAKNIYYYLSSTLANLTLIYIIFRNVEIFKIISFKSKNNVNENSE